MLNIFTVSKRHFFTVLTYRAVYFEGVPHHLANCQLADRHLINKYSFKKDSIANLPDDEAVVLPTKCQSAKCFSTERLGAKSEISSATVNCFEQGILKGEVSLYH
jgi:hypothetical protein